MRTAILVLLLVPLLLGIALAEKPNRVAAPVATGGSHNYNTQAPVAPGPMAITDSPGTVIGITSYEYQSNASMGKKIALDDFGGLHVSWTKGEALDGRPRYVNYNFRDETSGDWSWPEGQRISSFNGAGFTTIDLMGEGQAIVAYHLADATPGNSAVSVDGWRGLGVFTEYLLTPNADEYMFPYVVRDTNGRLHMAMISWDPADKVIYSSSTDDGVTWSDYVFVDNIYFISAIICTSPVSPKTAIVYPTTVGTNLFDVFYIESADGVNWDWNNKINITQHTPEDSSSAYFDVDAVYDYDDNLHISYQSALAFDGALYLDFTDLMHWSQATGHSVIATGPENCAQVENCLCVCKPNIGVDPSNNNVFAIWSELNIDDVSLGGFSNGELYAAASQDGGATWYRKVNLTNSPTPDCPAGECDSDIWCSLAKKVDNTLHIMYIDDNDAGAAWNGSGAWTFNNVLYLEVEASELLPLAIEDGDLDLPFDFALGQNYPNPFNANTVISIDGEIHSGKLAIYDVTGRMVRSFPLSEETRSITWDGTDSSGETVASGTYFYSVNFDEFGTAAVRKMTLLK